MPEDDATVEERLAVRLIREFEDLVHVERLVPPGRGCFSPSMSGECFSTS